MAFKHDTLWAIEPHTRAKHEILKRYLKAWVPILSLAGFPEVLYIDGFAGPGKYINEPSGSPILAIRAALQQRTNIRTKLSFRFIEKNERRAKVLQETLNNFPLPDNFKIHTYPGFTFEQAYAEIQHEYHKEMGGLPPTFAFIDPFGWTGIPFNIIKSILSYQSCETLITFMYEEINRFLSHPDQENNFDDLFGTPLWRDAKKMNNPASRNRFLHDLYMNQLKHEAKARYVRSFEMRNNKDVVDYYLFYATNNIRGLEKMKEAMWKVDESGEFTFSDATNPNQMVLFEKTPDFLLLEGLIFNKFQGQNPTVAQIEEFVLAETPFVKSHYKVNVLKKLENSIPPKIVIENSPASRRRGTYADQNMRVRFL